MDVGGCVVLAATPIGDFRDASARLRDALSSADVVAAEDTRRLRRLASDLDCTITGSVVSFHDHNEASRVESLIDQARDGKTVLVVSDAGMPTISDPGYRLVVAAQAASVRVTGLPGPSAVMLALALSGLATDRFAFDGFLPRRSGERRRAFAALASEPRTTVLFEAPHRLAASLQDAISELGGDRLAAICRELTKPHEEVRRGTLAQLAQWAEQGVRGEITLVIAAAPVVVDNFAGAVEGVRERMAQGMSRSAAAAEVARASGHRKQVLYDASLAEPGATSDE